MHVEVDADAVSVSDELCVGKGGRGREFKLELGLGSVSQQLFECFVFLECVFLSVF